MSRVVVLLAPGCEEMEAVTAIDILRRARFEVTAAGMDKKPVTASRGTVLVPDATLTEVMGKPFDAVVLPGGGAGTEHLLGERRVAELARRIHAQGGVVAAICAAPSVLAHAGLLDGRRATCYPGVLEPGDWPGIKLTGEAVTVDGTIVTSRGPGTAMDFALTLVELLGGTALRQQVEEGLVR